MNRGMLGKNIHHTDTNKTIKCFSCLVMISINFTLSYFLEFVCYLSLCAENESQWQTTDIFWCIYKQQKFYNILPKTVI
jgi:hypothetical protein